MNYVDFARYRDFASLALAQAETVATKAGGLCLRTRPHVIQFAWDTFDSAIAAMAWTVELGMRFNDWTEDPQNKSRANQTVETVSIYANRAFKIWCWAVSVTIEGVHNSRPQIEKAMASGRSLTIALTKEGVTQAMVMVRFLLALRGLIAQQDWEEVEEYPALPAPPRPLALLTPVKLAQAWEGDPWLAAAATGTAISTAPATVIAAETLLLLAAAPEPAPKTAKATKRRSSKTSKASGTRRKKTADEELGPAKKQRKPRGAKAVLA